MLVATVALGAALNPGGLISWLIIGLVAGFLASAIMRGGGYGIVGDLILGIVGAFIGGLLMNFILPNDNFGFWGSLIAAIIGACILIALLRLFTRGSERI